MQNSKLLQSQSPGITTVIGPAFCGKTKLVMNQLSKVSAPIFWIGTADTKDRDLNQLVEETKRDIPTHWIQKESPLDLERTLHDLTQTLASSMTSNVIVIDSVSTWLANKVFDPSASKYSDAQWLDVIRDATSQLTAQLQVTSKKHRIVVITAELGHGPPPQNHLSYLVRRAGGQLNQELARISDHVFLVQSGILSWLKISSN